MKNIITQSRYLKLNLNWSEEKRIDIGYRMSEDLKKIQDNRLSVAQNNSLKLVEKIKNNLELQDEVTTKPLKTKRENKTYEKMTTNRSFIWYI